MLHAALICLSVGLLVWVCNWSGLSGVPMQVYWTLTVGGLLMVAVHLMTRRPSRAWSGRQF